MAKGNIYRLTGNTFPCREEIKAIGGRWDPATTSWIVTAGNMAARAHQSQVLYQLERRGVKVEVVR